MAKLVTKITLGVDVAKDQLVVCNWQTEKITYLPNQLGEIKAWLKSFHSPLRIAIEPTSHYHMRFVTEAYDSPTYLGDETVDGADRTCRQGDRIRVGDFELREY